MSSDLVVRADEAPETVERELTLEKIRETKNRLGSLDATELSQTIIWAEAVAAAGRIKFALGLAREAAELRLRAERELGSLSIKGRLSFTSEIDVSHLGSYVNLAKCPDDLFEAAIVYQNEENGSLERAAVVRLIARLSLVEIESGIEQAWNGDFYVETPDGRLKRVKATSVEGARIERDSLARLQRKPDRSTLADSLDAAYANARRGSLNLSNLGAGRTGKVRELIGKAEAHYMHAAEALYKAYKYEIAERR